MPGEMDLIHYERAKTLSGLFIERIRRSDEKTAYLTYNAQTQVWDATTWRSMGDAIARWQTVLRGDDLPAGSRVAILLPNSIEWIQFDQAALGLGLVVVPLYVNDRAENLSYILHNAGVRVLLVDHLSQWREMEQAGALPQMQRIITRAELAPDAISERITDVAHYVPSSADQPIADVGAANDLASIVYTSGTTGRPKGVMLTHRNILWNAYSGMQNIMVYASDNVLSFLPLSHTLERSIGYYLTVMSGARVSFARSIAQLGQDLLSQKPTVLICVPRIFERVYGKIQHGLCEKSAFARWLFEQAVAVGWVRFLHQQKRGPWRLRLLFWPLLNRLVAAKVMAKLGGRLRFAIAGGAPMSATVAKTFVGLGVPIAQGYGLTEASPVISVNPLEDNVVESVGTLLPDVQVKIGAHDELLARSPGVMQGYWHNQEATDAIIKDGWLHTGDKAKITDGHLFITGRLKEIIVLSNGEKLPPHDMEMAICLSAQIEQAMVIGDNRPFLTALIVLNAESWDNAATDFSDDAKQQVLQIIVKQLHGFPGYAKIRAVHVTLQPWTVENDLITPTLKLKRHVIQQRFASEIEKLYAGH